jgi:hypothetical protein
MKKSNENILIKGLLHELSPEEEPLFQQLLEEKPEAVQTLHQWEKVVLCLRSFEGSLRSGLLASTLERITQMEALKQRQFQRYKLIRNISFSTAAALLLLLLYVVLQENALNLDGLLGIAGLKSDDFTNLLANY